MKGRESPDEAVRAATEGSRCVALRVRRLSRLVTGIYERALREHGITVAQFTLLGAMVLEGSLSPARLGRMLDLEKSTLSRNLQVLVSAGLVRIEGPSAGGGQTIRVTGRGKRALVNGRPAWCEAQARVVEALGDVVVEGLDAMIAALGLVRRRGARAAGPRNRTQRGSPYHRLKTAGSTPSA
jgi:DNA-binding MarR family transcriptional regulator